MKKLKREDFTFNYDYCGYKIFYKGKSIGGVGINNKDGRKRHSNLDHNCNQAQIMIRNIVHNGRCPDFMKTNIINIDNGS